MKRIMASIISVIMFIPFFAVNSQSLTNAGLSLLFPGTGLHSTGNSRAGYIFNSIEAVTAISTGVFYFSSVKTGSDALNYASSTLNMPLDDYDLPTLQKMELYISSDYYNSLLPAKARDLFPDDAAKQEQYIADNSIPDSMSWEWQDYEYMNSYYTMKKQSRLLKQYFIYAATSIALNHIVSGIFTFFDIENRLNVKLENAVGYMDGSNAVMRINMRF